MSEENVKEPTVEELDEEEQEDVKAKIEACVAKIDLNKDTEKLAQEVVSATDMGQLKDLTNLFNVNIAKKSVLRIMKLSSLLENVEDEVINRIEREPDAIKDKDLIGYMNALQGAIEKSTKLMNGVDTTAPVINIKQDDNSVNISVNSQEPLSRDSKQTVIDTVKAILNLSSLQEEDVIEVEMDDVDEDEEIEGEN